MRLANLAGWAGAGLVIMLALGPAPAAPPPSSDPMGGDCEPYQVNDRQADPFRRSLQTLVTDIGARTGATPNVNLCEARGYLPLIGVDHIRRVIVYDRPRLAAMPQNRGRNEVATVMIAHEMGHFILRQRQSRDPAVTRTNELAADEFAGFAMRRLGLDIGIGARVFRQILPATDRPGAGPGRVARIAAFERGFNRDTAPAATPQPAPDPEEEADGPDEAEVKAGSGAPVVGPPTEAQAPSPSLWRQIIDFLNEAGTTITAIGAAAGVLYGGYRWLRRQRRRRRPQSDG